jgi:hypothetical protein
VVCKPGSRRRIERRLRGAVERRNLRLLRRCRFRHIQAAVNRARSGQRILVLPGVYSEQPSRRVPSDDPRCEGDRYEGEERGTKSYAFQRDCPNAQNLIAITGDDGDPDRRCDDKCNLQIEGTGRRPSDIKVMSAGFGDRPDAKLNVFRADRAGLDLPAQLPRPVLGLQQHLRHRDERLQARADRLPLEPRVRLPQLHFG